MYQIELSPRKATPTQAKKQIAQLIYTCRCVFICLPQPQHLHLRTRVFNFGVPSPNFTATWYLSTLSSLLFVNHNNNMCCMMFQLSYCFWFDIYIYIYIFFIFCIPFVICDLKCGKWKHGYWLGLVFIVLGLFYCKLCYADFVCGIQTH